MAYYVHKKLRAICTQLLEELQGWHPATVQHLSLCSSNYPNSLLKAKKETKSLIEKFNKNIYLHRMLTLTKLTYRTQFFVNTFQPFFIRPYYGNYAFLFNQIYINILLFSNTQSNCRYSIFALKESKENISRNTYM